MVSFNFSSSPFSFRSIFHGVSLLLVLTIILSVTVGLWRINYHELYEGGMNACFAGNTIGTYGGDTFVYCPRTSIISVVNITGSAFPVSVINLPASEILMRGSTYSEVGYQTIYIDDDDEEISWYFNFNPGTSLLMNFTQVADNAAIYLQIDDEDVGYDIPSGSSGQYVFKPEKLKNGLPSHGYKFSITTDGDTRSNVGFISFGYNQTQYSNQQASQNTTCPYLNKNCLWELETGSDICFWTYNPFTPRLTSSDYTPYCAIVLQDGRDSRWMGILFPVGIFLIVVILVVNFLVAFLSHRFRSKAYQLQPVSTHSHNKYKILEEEN